MMKKHSRQQRLDMTLDDRLQQQEGWVLYDRHAGAGACADPATCADEAAGLNTGGYISGVSRVRR